MQIYTSLGRSTCSQSGRPNPLPGSYGHETQDAKWYASINADGMKGDWYVRLEPPVVCCSVVNLLAWATLGPACALCCAGRCNAGGLDIQNVTTTMANAINATGHPLWCVMGTGGGGGCDGHSVRSWGSPVRSRVCEARTYTPPRRSQWYGSP